MVHKHADRKRASAAPLDPAREALARQARRRRRWAIGALVFPLIVATVIAIGLVAMFYRHMEFFRPAPSSRSALPCCAPLVHAGAAHPKSAQS